ncbi:MULTISPECIES: hypothetical protein [Paenibacillus]|uniref:DUF5668 domain-containing protein n=1 Tax=Paenibacillus radicis (ex Gao et al. 2016) TaxID=1737354 RepID=A0A917MCV9_9BACL|nr:MULTISPECIES: hypothetical protein [Paenibacillus]GGG89104.1 hypothetical protein GCM10010918_54740 [Paenibacillus radicis (ex Gao et al. 2016)]
MPNNKYSAGILVLLAGVVILLGKLGVFSFLGAIFWPLLVLIPGILLHVFYFGRLFPAAVLVPGGILIVYAVLFIVCNIFGWNSLKYLWPLFIFGIAVGLYEYYLLSSTKERVILTASIALAASSAVFLALVLLWSWGIYAIAIVLIGAGSWMLFGRRNRW